MKVRPDVGASLAAGLADKPGLEIRKPDVISPLFRADRDRMAISRISAKVIFCGRVREGMRH